MMMINGGYDIQLSPLIIVFVAVNAIDNNLTIKNCGNK